MESKKPDPKEIAKMKILQQLGKISANTNKRRRRKPKSSLKLVNPLKRQDACQMKTSPSKIKVSGSGTSHAGNESHSHKTNVTNSHSSSTVTSAQRKPGVLSQSTNKASTKTTGHAEKDPNSKAEVAPVKASTDRKIMFVNATELPAPTGVGFQRRSSWTTRKKVDNKLGYEGRRNHRHSWQERRQSEYYGEKSSDSD